MQSYILIYTEAWKAHQVVRKVRALQGIDHADAVTGAYDVIARASVRTMDELDELAKTIIHSIPGVLRALTCPVAGHGHVWEEHPNPVYAAV